MSFHEKSNFKAPFTPLVNYLVLVLFAAILVIMLFADETRPALLLTPLWFVIYRMVSIQAMATYDPAGQDLEKTNIAPNGDHWFGTDDLGRDVWSRTWYELYF